MDSNINASTLIKASHDCQYRAHTNSWMYGHEYSCGSSLSPNLFFNHSMTPYKLLEEPSELNTMGRKEKLKKQTILTYNSHLHQHPLEEADIQALPWLLGGAVVALPQRLVLCIYTFCWSNCPCIRFLQLSMPVNSNPPEKPTYDQHVAQIWFLH